MSKESSQPGPAAIAADLTTPAKGPGAAGLPARADLSHYDARVLQGGGARCFYTLGFLEVVGPALTGVRQVAAVSASAAMACAHLAGGHREALSMFAARVRTNPRNFYPDRLLRGERPTPGPQNGRKNAMPLGGKTTLLDAGD